MIRYDLLVNNPGVIPIIAGWHWEEWGHHRPGDTVDNVIERISQRTHRDRLPLSYIAYDGEDPVGTASLIRHDMDSRLELSPWLAGVFVLPAFRRQGIGSGLVNLVVEKSTTLGFDRIFLYSRSAIVLYRCLGWETIDRVLYRGDIVEIMQYTQLSPR